jgi:hypothetical protein
VVHADDRAEGDDGSVARRSAGNRGLGEWSCSNHTILHLANRRPFRADSRVNNTQDWPGDGHQSGGRGASALSVNSGRTGRRGGGRGTSGTSTGSGSRRPR